MAFRPICIQLMLRLGIVFLKKKKSILNISGVFFAFEFDLNEEIRGASSIYNHSICNKHRVKAVNCKTPFIVFINTLTFCYCFANITNTPATEQKNSNKIFKIKRHEKASMYSRFNVRVCMRVYMCANDCCINTFTIEQQSKSLVSPIHYMRYT